MIDTLMMAYTVEMVSVEKVIACTQQYSSFFQATDLPYDIEDAVMFWINKVCIREKQAVIFFVAHVIHLEVDREMYVRSSIKTASDADCGFPCCMWIVKSKVCRNQLNALCEQDERQVQIKNSNTTYDIDTLNIVLIFYDGWLRVSCWPC